MREPRRLVVMSTLVVALLAVMGVPAAEAKAKASRLSGSITVSAAASLTKAFTRMGTDFEKANRGTTVTFNFAASSTLATQIQGGAPADVFASADGANMQRVVASDHVADPVDFAANILTIVVKKGNPKNVKTLADLPRLGIVSLCVASVPCGRYAIQMLARDGVNIPTNKVTLGQDVTATLTDVSVGDADAAIVYVTDAKSARSSVAQVKIPGSLNDLAIYPIARVAASQNAKLADKWVDYVLSPAGQRTLSKFGFLPAPAT